MFPAPASNKIIAPRRFGCQFVKSNAPRLAEDTQSAAPATFMRSASISAADLELMAALMPEAAAAAAAARGSWLRTCPRATRLPRFCAARASHLPARQQEIAGHRRR